MAEDALDRYLVAHPEAFPPNSIEAEESLLGSVLLWASAAPDKEGNELSGLPDLFEWLLPQAFYRDRHVFIYEAMVRLHRRGDRPHRVAVAYELAYGAAAGVLEACGGADYLSWLISVCPTWLYAASYADIVQTAYERRLRFAAGAASKGKRREERIEEMKPTRPKTVLDGYER